MQVFYQEEIQSPECLLRPEEARHAVTVLRMKEGDNVSLIDGKGCFYKGIILSIKGKEVLIKIQETIPEYGKRPYQLHLLIAPTKNMDRMEWLVEKAVEIGIDTITPMLCMHSERKKIRMDRLEKIIISSMKQSLNAYKPALQPLTPFREALKNCPESLKTLAHCREELPRTTVEKEYSPGESLAICIGPEGDFSQEEIHLSEQMGFKSISMGDSRLRTETAGLMACCTAAFLNRPLSL